MVEGSVEVSGTERSKIPQRGKYKAILIYELGMHCGRYIVVNSRNYDRIARAVRFGVGKGWLLGSEFTWKNDVCYLYVPTDEGLHCLSHGTGWAEDAAKTT